MSDKRSVSLSIGDRNSPLEANIESDPERDHPLVGSLVEVSPVAGGDLQGLRGKKAKVRGVLVRFGEIVGYEIAIGKNIHFGSLKDIFVNRMVLEDVRPATATSAAVKEALEHWAQSRTYWHTRLDGLENLCFELAAVTPALTVSTDSGFQFFVPEPLGDQTVVDLRVMPHDNYWTMGVTVFSRRPSQLKDPPPRVPSHWDRTFAWTERAGAYWAEQAGLPWAPALKALQARRKASERVLRPLVAKTMERVVVAKSKLTGDPPEKVGEVHAAFSSVRLKAATIGLTEPPTDKRPYTVVSISPEVVKKKGYLEQVVLHECIHIGVASTGGKPHNDEFIALSKMLGLEPKYRD